MIVVVTPLGDARTGDDFADSEIEDGVVKDQSIERSRESAVDRQTQKIPIKLALPPPPRKTQNSPPP